MTPKVTTACKSCRRCIYASDLDRDGNCCFCQPTTSEAMKMPLGNVRIEKPAPKDSK